MSGRTLPAHGRIRGVQEPRHFVKAVERELAASSVPGDERGREQPKPKRKALAGEPGSKRRMEQVSGLAGGDAALVNAVARDVSAEKLLGVVRHLQRHGFNTEAIREAVDLSLALDRQDVAHLVYANLDDASADLYEEQLMQAIVQRERDAERAEQARADKREAMYQAEYDAAEATSPAALNAVDAIANKIGADELYDDRNNPNLARAAMRTGGMAAESQRAAVTELGMHNALDEEIRRGVGAPGSSWTDAERERWESELEDTSFEASARKLLNADEAADIAVESLMVEDSGDPFIAELGKELDALSTPPEHAQRLRDQAVEEWERQHPEDR
jgi:DNA-binding transcriptional MerR regulator